MKKILKWIVTLIIPLLLLKGAVWVLNYASYDDSIYFTDHSLPIFSDWQYWVKILLYAAVAVYLFYLYQSKYSKKELAVLAIPVLYLLFFSLPVGIIHNNVTIMTFFLKYYPGLNVPVLLLFAYLVKMIATAIALKRAGKQQERKNLSPSPALEDDVS